LSDTLNCAVHVILYESLSKLDRYDLDIKSCSLDNEAGLLKLFDVKSLDIITFDDIKENDKTRQKLLLTNTLEYLNKSTGQTSTKGNDNQSNRHWFLGNVQNEPNTMNEETSIKKPSLNIEKKGDDRFIIFKMCIPQGLHYDQDKINDPEILDALEKNIILQITAKTIEPGNR
jgi:hypothetical protein